MTIDLDSNEDFLEYMNKTFPKALEKLGEICEKKENEPWKNKVIGQLLN